MGRYIILLKDSHNMLSQLGFEAIAVLKRHTTLYKRNAG